MAFTPPEMYQINIRMAIERASEDLRRFMVSFLQEFNQEVVMNTPVDTGYLRGSWSASIGSPLTEGGAPDPSGGATVAKINLVAAQIGFDESYFLTNGAHYAGYVEYGTSRMAPRAFLRRAVDRAPALAQEVAATIRRP